MPSGRGKTPPFPRIMLDYDGQPPANLLGRIGRLCRFLRVRPGVVQVRRTKRGYHVLFTLRRRLPPLAVVAVQAILGSDAVRESFNLMRALVLDEAPAFWRDRYNVLYSSKSKERPR